MLKAVFGHTKEDGTYKRAEKMTLSKLDDLYFSANINRSI
jgi:hypothetical protein